MEAASPPQCETQPLAIGTRNSKLALIQANHVASLLSAAHPGLKTQIRTVMVRGDADKTTPFLLMADKIYQERAKQQQQTSSESQTAPNGQDHPFKQEVTKAAASDAAKSLWTEEMEIMLGQGELDLLVHCLKDMPTTLGDDCSLGAVIEREDPTDAVVMKAGYTGSGGLGDLPDGAVIGTSSTRRKALLKRLYPKLIVKECRGNVDTRLRKLDDPNGEFSCIILASAGLTRLGLTNRISSRLSPHNFPYAVGQGALGIEVRSNDPRISSLLTSIERHDARWTCLAERALLRHLQGGCSSPIGVETSVEKNEDVIVDGVVTEKRITVRLYGMIVHPHGWTDVKAEAVMQLQSDEDAETLGRRVADLLLENGANEILAEIKANGQAGFGKQMELTSDGKAGAE